MTNDEISTLAVNALMDKIAAMVKKGKPVKGLTEDEHAIAMAHAITEIQSAFEVYWQNEKNAGKTEPTKPWIVWLGVCIRAIKNGSQMRQVAEKRKILEVSAKGDKVADVFAQYS
jgi:hypothetical protein